ncbi:MAG: hypothetical protein ACFCU1_07545 [Sumerlaeia bacterium]
MFEKFSLPIKPINWENDSNRRLLMYCSSDTGLGHFSRLSRIAMGIKSLDSSVQILFLTDILPQPSQDFNDHFAVIKLPGYIHSNKKDAAAGLKIDHEILQRLRVNLISTTLWSFQPHVFLMDTGPHGKKNELAKPLAWMQRHLPNTKRILQFRDIPVPPAEYFDPTESYQDKFLNQHNFYHHFIVSGHKNLFDIAKEYHWPPELEQKLHYCGLVVPKPRNSKPTQQQLNAQNVSADEAPRKRLLISFGGGWDSDFLAPLMVETLKQLVQKMKPSPQVHLFTGPAISDESFALLEKLTHELPLTLVRYSSDFPSILAQADVAFLQGGSTAYQILESDKPMIIYTREYSTQEQQCRADLLGKFPDITIINQDWAKTNSLAKLLQEAFAKPKLKRKTGLTYNGIQEAAEFIINQLPKR